MTLFCFDLSRVFLQGATMPPTPQNFLKICIRLQCGKEIALRFFTSPYLGFLQGSTMPSRLPRKKGMRLIQPGGVMLLLRLIYGISEGCHHALPTPYKNFLNFGSYVDYKQAHCRSTRDDKHCSSACQLHVTACNNSLAVCRVGWRRIAPRQKTLPAECMAKRYITAKLKGGRRFMSYRCAVLNVQVSKGSRTKDMLERHIEEDVGSSSVDGSACRC